MRIAIDWKKVIRDYAVMLVAGTFLAIIQPYGVTRHLSFFQGWLYWTGLILYGSTVGMLISRLTLKWLDGKPSLIILLVISTGTALLITPVIATIHYLMGQSEAFASMHILYVFVWVITAGMTGIGWMMHLLNEKKDEANAGNGTDMHESTVRSFMSRLPLPYRNGDLYAISSEDHYLRVHTSAGEHLFLERLSTVIHQLEGAQGLQTHRSWWVAEQGVESAKSQNGRITLTLKSGVEAPVSRTFASAVRSAGWV